MAPRPYHCFGCNISVDQMGSGFTHLVWLLAVLNNRLAMGKKIVLIIDVG
tara:strand:+ start:622 stop:771 length:150 start_codon:yes stop_codon:yes gene_type:complete